MKKVYIINLDKQRIFILSGVMLLLFGVAFLGGHYLAKSRPSVNDSFQQFMNTADVNGTGNAAINNHAYANKVINNNISSGVADDGIANHALNRNTNIDQIENNFTGGTTRNANLSPIKIEKDPFILVPSGDSKTSANHSKTKKNSNNVKLVSKKENFYTIQFAAFKRETDALKYSKTLNEQGVEARVDRGIKFYFVRSGKSKDKNRVEDLYKKIHDRLKLEGIVVFRKLS